MKNKKMLQKILACTMSICICIPMLTACGEKDKQASSGSGNEPYTIKWLEQADPTIPYDAEKDVIKKAIEERLNIKIEPEFVEYSQYNQKLSLRIASGDVPDLVNRVARDSDYIKYSRNGIFFDMTDYISPEKTPNIWREVPEEYWEMAKVDGRIYGIPYIYGVGVGYRYNLVMRKDYLEAVGAKQPKTLDEYHEVLKKIKEWNPDIIPLGAVSSTGLPEFSIRSFDHIFNAFGVQPGYFYENNGTFGAYDIDPRMKEALRYLQTMYAEDLIDKEFLTIKETSFKDKLFAGKVFSFVTQWGNPANWDLTVEQNKLKNEGSDIVLGKERLNDDFACLQPMSSLEGVNGNPVAGAPAPFQTMIAISATTQDPEKLLQIIDQAHAPENASLILGGIEGEDYLIENGQKKAGPMKVDPTTKLDPNGNYRDRDRYCFVTQKNGVPHWKDGMNPRALKCAEIALENPYQIFCASNYLESETKTQKMSELNSMRDAVFSQIIMGEDIDTFDQFVQDWKQQGGEKILRELEESYQKKN